MRQIEISTEFIKLDSLLKFCGAAPTGDNTAAGLWISLAVLGLCGIGAAAVMVRRKKTQNGNADIV